MKKLPLRMLLYLLQETDTSLEDPLFDGDDSHIIVSSQLADSLTKKMMEINKAGDKIMENALKQNNATITYHRNRDDFFKEENLKFAYAKERKVERITLEGGGSISDLEIPRETGRVLTVGWTVVSFGEDKEIEFATAICCPDAGLRVKKSSGELRFCSGDRFSRKIGRRIVSTRIKNGKGSQRIPFQRGLRPISSIMHYIGSNHESDSARRLARQWIEEENRNIRKEYDNMKLDLEVESLGKAELNV